MIEKTFAKGNYNEWEKFVKETLPQQSELFRSKLIPSIDEVLESMLGVYSNIHKTSIDIAPTFDEYLTIKAIIVYGIDDFEAPDVPTDAVKKDEDAVRAFLEEQFKDTIANKPGFVKAMWCGDLECEMKIKEDTTATSRCMPFEQEQLSDKCVCCGKPAKTMVYWGKAY